MTDQAYLHQLVNTELLPILSQVSPDVASTVETYVDTFAKDDKKLAEAIGDITGPFWSHFDQLTRACILQSPGLDMQYLLIYVATTRTAKQLSIFKQAFDLIFTDIHARLSQMESKVELANYITSKLNMSDLATLTFWQSRKEEMLPAFWELLKKVVYAVNGPYAQTQRDALDILLMMRPFVMIELSDRQNTNELMQEALSLLERVSRIHRFDLIRALNNLYPELANVDLDVNMIMTDLGWRSENFITHIIELTKNESKRREAIEKIEQRSNESGTSAIGIFLRCKAQLKSELNLDLSTSMLFQAFGDGRIQLTDMSGLLGKLMTAINEEQDEQSDGVAGDDTNAMMGNIFGNLDAGDIVSQITRAFIMEGMTPPTLENPELD